MENIVCRTGNFECDYTDTRPDKSVIYGNHCHLTCELMLILEGEVSLAVEDRTYRNLGSGCMIMIPPLTYHSSFSDKPCRYRRITVRFGEDAIPEPIRETLLKKMKETPVLPLPADSYPVKRLLWVLTEKNVPEYHPLLESILVELLYDPLRMDPVAVWEEKDVRLRPVIAYIDAHLDSAITLDELAKAGFLSVSTLTHLFRDRMKISVKQYILQKKMHYAAGLIRGGLPAVKAAEAVGYRNYADFYTVYKKMTGELPSGAKKSNGKTT